MFEVDRHLLVNEGVELVTDPLADHIHRLVAMPGSVNAGAWARDRPRCRRQLSPADR